jgi:hypothetical protein
MPYSMGSRVGSRVGNRALEHQAWERPCAVGLVSCNQGHSEIFLIHITDNVADQGSGAFLSPGSGILDPRPRFLRL